MSKKVVLCGIDTASLPKLTASEARELMAKVKSGDKRSRGRYIMCNMRLVLSVVQRYSSRVQNLDDLFQVGCVGLVKAVDNFNTDYNLRFSTYAVPMIVGEIRRFLRESNSLHVSRRIRDLAYLALQAREKLELSKNTGATLEEIAKEINQPVFEVQSALDAISDPISLHDPVFSDDNDSVLVMDQIKDKSSNDDNWINSICLSEAISKLSEKEKTILHKRYIEGKTQMEISKEVGISQAQVSRLEKNVAKFLKASI